MFHTQTTDTFIDNFTHPPVEHPTEEVARTYAIEASARKRSEVKVFVGDAPPDTYENGELKAAN